MTIEINKQAKPKAQPRRSSIIMDDYESHIEYVKWKEEMMFLMDQYAQYAKLKQQLEMEKFKDNV